MSTRQLGVGVVTLSLLISAAAVAAPAVNVELNYEQWETGPHKRDFAQTIKPAMMLSLLEQLRKRYAFIRFEKFEKGGAAEHKLSFTLLYDNHEVLLHGMLEGPNLRPDEDVPFGPQQATPKIVLPIVTSWDNPPPGDPDKFAERATDKLAHPNTEPHWTQFEKQIISRVAFSKHAQLEYPDIGWLVDVRPNELCIRDRSGWVVAYNLPSHRHLRLVKAFSQWARDRDGLFLSADSPDDLVTELRAYEESLAPSKRPGEAKLRGVYLVGRVFRHPSECRERVRPKDAVTD